MVRKTRFMQALITLFLRFWQSSIGKKIIVALTGLVLVGFLVGHLAGNLLIFGGHKLFNEYAKWLHDRPLLVWSARLGLLAAFLLHIIATVSLVRANRAAKPTQYALNRPQVSS